MRTAIAALVLGAATALTLAACGEQTGSDTAREAATATAGFNDADVAFAQQMIPHHQQAVQMAEMARSHTRSADVRRLAAGIEAAQGPEIETMTGWLEEWGEDVPGGHMAHGDMGHGMGRDGDGAMPGMMDGHRMGALGRASDGAWDRMFLRMMIEHHEGAIEMARAEVADGEHEDAVALAERIIETQQAEIDQMRQMLRS
ncbi:MAG TPA: DUF305 domain-containing protein [Nocardioides sp.]|nr:DUF305 domain-containing protein [Nocardioides sp.]